MICKNCGWQNEAGSRFCEKCGRLLEYEYNVTEAQQPAVNPPAGYGYTGNDPASAPPIVSTWPPLQMPPVQAQPEKKKTRLIIGLAAGGALVIIAVILIAALSGHSPVEGVWYSEDLGVVLEFQNNGLVVSYTPDGRDEGNYTFNSNSNKGMIKADGEEFDFRLEDRRITVQSIGAFQKADKHFDIDDFISGFQDQNGS